MRRAAVARSAALLVTLVAAVPAAALPCATFTDVEDTDFFCPDVQWLRNRAVTNGCAATLYCPDTEVTRAQMALFMRRLGRPLSPAVIGLQANFPATSIGAGALHALCVTAGPDPATFSRTAVARGAVTAPLSGNAVDMSLLVSIDSAPYVAMNSVALRVPAPAGREVLHWLSGPTTIPASATAQFAIGIANAGSGAAVSLGTGQCSIEVGVANANPDSPPLDGK